MFQSARIRLTVWYLVIIMIISVMFSVAFYNLATREIQRVIRAQQYREENPLFMIIERPQTVRPINIEDLEESKQRLKLLLVLINGAIVVVAGGAAYFLAGITLRPIVQMVDEQNRFISDSSHELRTPLTSLRSEIEVALRNKDLSLEEARKLLESNLEETIALQTLSDRLLDLAQNGDQTLKQTLQKVSLSKIISTSVRRVEKLAAKNRIKIAAQIKDVKIQAVEDRLAEVFVILLDNAIKYSPAGSTVTIKSKRNKGQAEISVANSGSGIEKKDLPHIFNRFFRADRSRSQITGYGLGLSIAKKIIDSHGGEISAKSVPGKETVFTVLLPIKNA